MNKPNRLESKFLMKNNLYPCYPRSHEKSEQAKTFNTANLHKEA